MCIEHSGVPMYQISDNLINVISNVYLGNSAKQQKLSNNSF